MKADKSIRPTRLRLRAMVGLACAILCALMVYAGLYLLESKGGLLWDMTPDALTTLSKGTLSTLNDLPQTVRLHLVFQQGTSSESRRMLEIVADSYARAGAVEVDVIDPVAQPGRVMAFADAGSTVAEGSVIVTNADETRHAVVAARDMFAYEVDASGAYVRTGMSAERRLTAAIRSVIGQDAPRVCFLTGHDEAGLERCAQLAERLIDERYTVADVTLPGDALAPSDVLLILSPARDLTGAELEAIDAFLASGGRMLFCCDATVDLDALPRFASLASRFSLAFEPGLVVEDERSTDYWTSSPLYLMPHINAESAVASGLSGAQRLILPGARAVSGPAMPLSGYDYDALLTTSGLAYIKRTDSTAFTREADDPTGVQQLAVSVSHTDGQSGAETRAVLMGTLYAAADNGMLASTYNLDFTLGVIGYLAEREDAASVPVRALGDTSMGVPSAGEGFRMLAVALCLPLAAVMTGAVVLIRRRRK